VTLRIELTAQRGVGFFAVAGHDYEVFDGERLVCHGWSAGGQERSKHNATDHARRVLRMQARRAAAAVTGEDE
jgi:hypothetical protein